jgi:O-glycosyl hydrolase
MKKICGFVIALLQILPGLAQTGLIEDFEGDTLIGWLGYNYTLHESGGEMLIEGERTGMWDAFDYNFSGIDMSGDPYVSLEIRSNFSLAMAVGVGIHFTDGSGQEAYTVFYPERISVLPYAFGTEQEIVESPVFQQFSYDFTGISFELESDAVFNGITGPATLTDIQILSAVSNLHFLPNPLGNYPGTTLPDPKLFFDNVRAGSEAFNTPAISTVPDQEWTVMESGTAPIEVKLRNITDGADDTQIVSITATSSNLALIPDPVVTYNSGERYGTLILSPNDNVNGESTISVTVSSPGAQDDKVMTFKVSALANAAPTMDSISDQIAIAGIPLKIPLLNVDDGNDEVEQIITVTASSSDPSVIPDPAVSFDPLYMNGSIEIVPDQAAAAGSKVLITLGLADDGGSLHGGMDRRDYSFEVTIYDQINHPPVFDLIDDLGMPGVAGVQTILLSGVGDGDDGTQTLTWTVSSSDESVVSGIHVGPVVHGEAILSFELSGVLGSSVITLRVTDNGGDPENNGDESYQQSFTLTTLNMPSTGLVVDFESGGSPADYGFTGQEGYDLSIVDGELYVQCDYPGNSFPGMWWTVSAITGGSELDISASPYLSIRFRNSTENDNGIDNETRIIMFLWDQDLSPDQAYLNTEQTIFTPEDGLQKEFFVDFSNSFYEDEEGQVDSTRINSLLINLDNRWFYPVKGEYWIDEIRMGDSVVIAEPPQNTIDDVPDQVVKQGAAPAPILLTGISNGEDRGTTDLTFTVSNAALVNGVAIGSVVGGTAQLEYTLGPGTGSCEISIIANNLRTEEDIPDTVSFTVYVMDEQAGNAVVTIDASTGYQEFRGIGGVISDDEPESMINTINDLNWTLMRIFGDFDYIEPVNDNGDPNVIARDHLVPNETTLQNMRLINENTNCHHFFYTPLTPPVWMKTNKSEFPFDGEGWIGNNHIDPSYYDEFAEFLVEVVKMIKEKAGIELYAISIQNEPQFNEPYPSTQIFAPEFVDILNVVGPKFAAEGLNTKILMSEDVHQYGWLTDRVNAVNNDATARDHMGVIGFHAYTANGIDNGFADRYAYENLQKLFQKTEATDLWMTESSGWVDAWEGEWGLAWNGLPQFMEGAFGVAGGYYMIFKYAQANGWADLNSTQFLAPQKHLQAVTKHYTFFTNSGDVMIETSSGDDAVLSVGFKNRATDAITVTIINTAHEPRVVQLEGDNLPSSFRHISSKQHEPWKEQVPISNELVMAPRSVVTLYSQVANIAPVIDPVTNQIATLEEGPIHVDLSGISDGNPDQAQVISLSALSGDESVATVVSDYVSDNASGTLTITPHSVGKVVISVTLKDDGGTDNGGTDTHTMTFEVEVFQERNSAPTMDGVENLALLEDDGLQTINITGITNGDGDSGGISVIATSSNPDLIPDPEVEYSTNASSGTIRFQPEADMNGVTTVFITLLDEGGTGANNGDQSITLSFMVTVDPVNDAPAIHGIEDIVLTSYVTQLPVSIEGIGDGDPELDQMLTVSATSTDEGIASPAVIYTPGDETGSLVLNLSEQNGTATIEVIVQDDGGTANGGINTAVISFDVTLNLTSSISAYEPGEVQIYPVPAGTMISVSTTSNAMFDSYSVLDLSGTVLLNQKITADRIAHIPVHELVPGTYLIKLDSDRGSLVKSFIKR